MLCGDDEEHAVLLACYFLYLEKIKFTTDNELSELDNANSEEEDFGSVFLCLGEAVPEGRTIYVLTRKQKRPDSKHAIVDSWHLWNPSTGDSYSVNNVSCPMRAVYGLVSAKNVWANIQTKHEPWEIDWDLSAKNAWTPVFPNNFQSKKHPSHSVNVKRHSPVLSTVQPSYLIYGELDSRETDLIKFDIEATLRDALMDWRKSKITRLNYEYVSDLTKVLENLERHNGQRYDGLTQVLDRITSKYHVYGFPMNFPYMKTEAIIERVRSKGIHELHGIDGFVGNSTTEDRSSRIATSKYATSVQYAVAVYVKAYKGPVLSIWIYLAALWRR
ncbi:coiled-coil and C2 domain-containing protein 2A [Paragonimus westermani]|uniref:Coiled-coil and C2 domain-containing protein 2A n=1 Tax=Paragonimus westermani TaxID=34504 RepID=A0A5J4NP33_9TREM|nr:coiled-coil and C2 domain-containing protein 2A [Paragonimus westermani]